MQTTTRAIHGDTGTSRVKREPTKLLSMYSVPPTAEITLDNFELYALDRLQVLRTLEMLRSKNFRAHEFRAKLDEVLDNCLPMRTGSPQEITKDQISHFILRIAYCRNEDLRRWFLTQESGLFRYRLERLEPGERAKFMEQNNLAYDAVSKEDLIRLRNQLQAIPSPPIQGTAPAPADFTKSQYFRIPFTQALDLVSKREVYLEGGYAYVPVDRLVSIIVARFRTHLSRALLDAFNSFPYILADARIAPLISNMSKQYVGKDYSKVKAQGEVTVDQLNALAETSYPLCMRELHRTLRQNHKLKHDGRLQYGLFLKAIGLSMEDSLAFFQEEFTKIMTMEDYNKNYSYSVRHYYGKEGRRKDYTPWSCVKIISMTAPMAEQRHGCPFKHYDEGNLGRLLDRSGVGYVDREEIIQMARTNNYGPACQRHFEVAHPKAEQMINMEGIGNHPNAWFEASRAYYRNLNKDKEPAGTSGGGVREKDNRDDSMAVDESQEGESTAMDCEGD